MKEKTKHIIWTELGWLLPAWMAMAWLATKASWFWQHNPELQFGWIVLMLSGYLFYEAWEIRPDFRFHWSATSLLLVFLGGGLLGLTQLYQSAYGLTAASMSGLGVGAFLVVLGNVVAVFGWSGARHFVFPFLFFMIALPIPSVIYSPIVIGLQSMVATINVEILNLIGIPAQQTGSLIHLPTGTVGIDEACSGVRSLQSTVMATLFIGYLILKRNTLRITLLLAGIVLAIMGNLVRSLFLSMMVNSHGLESIEKYHDSAGWSVLAFTVVGVIGLAWFINYLQSRHLLHGHGLDTDDTDRHE